MQDSKVEGRQSRTGVYFVFICAKQACYKQQTVLGNVFIAGQAQPVLVMQGSNPDEGKALPPCLLKDFKVERVLGTGSFGRVSLARHVATGRVCAIKALSKATVLKNQQVCTAMMPLWHC